ncbi:hypothetical protein [Candidatus Binatus sp.]|uniref:hypothetical protein n=1 Tax=Candidatus Binatus sp. TaxID=2811406 RepID=UPI003C357341
MKFSKNIMTGLIGVALMAAPITAAAQDHKDNSRQAQSESRSNESRGSAPAHNAAPATHNKSRDQHSARTETPRTETHAAAPANMNRNEGRDERGARETRNAAPAVATRNESRDNGRTYNNAPAVATNRDSRDYGNRGGNDWNHGDRDGRNYGRDYDHDDYGHDREYAASGWAMPGGYYGGACGWAQHLRNVIRHDEYTGHPAAASDLIYQLHRAERACGGVPYGYNNWRY